MENLKEMLYEPNLKKLGFYRDRKMESKEGPSWIHFTCPSELGQGYYRFYFDSNLFAISVWELKLKHDLIHDFKQTDYISVGCLDAGEGEILKPFKKRLTPCIMGYLGRDEVFRLHIRKNKPYRGVGITIMPEYYQDYLQSAYPEEYENPREAFTGIDGIFDSPEFRLLFSQIGSYRSRGISARLFFVGKVAECISLIVERTKMQKLQKNLHYICAQDRENLKSVVSYIERHLDGTLLLEDLARIARMGTTKLKYTFKQVYNSNISVFILARRLNRAEFLLSNSDLNISQVSRSVGYKNASSFSEVFRKNRGLLPNEYRKYAASKNYGAATGNNELPG
jgi:AraC-like DNA-binding protein